LLLTIFYSWNDRVWRRRRIWWRRRI
jgi:hypothetical protein